MFGKDNFGSESVDCDGTFNRMGGTLTETGGTSMGGGRLNR